MDRTREHPQRRPCGGDTPATLERDRQAPRAVSRQDSRAVIGQEYADPRIASGMEARRAETVGGYVPESASGSVHDSPAQWSVVARNVRNAGRHPNYLAMRPNDCGDSSVSDSLMNVNTL
jgi:hypothetical protein